MVIRTFASVRRSRRLLASQSEVVDMANESVLIEVVREWGAQQPGCDSSAAEGAASVAARAYANGASVTEACQAARAYLRSWIAHPSHLLVTDRSLSRSRLEVGGRRLRVLRGEAVR
jgi:hypothetical protein